MNAVQPSHPATSHNRYNMFQYWSRRPRSVEPNDASSVSSSIYPRKARGKLSISANKATTDGESMSSVDGASFITAPTAVISSRSIVSTTLSMIGPIADFVIPVTEKLPPPVNYQLTENASFGFGFLCFAAEHVAIDALAELAVQHEKPICYLRADLIPESDSQLGNDVFTDPLVAEALETLFVLVTVDADPDERGSYPEEVCLSIPTDDSAARSTPPTIGFLGQNGKSLAKPLSYFQLSKLSLLQAIGDALRNHQHTVPRYVQILTEEASAYDSVNNRVRQAFVGVVGCMIRHAEVEFAGLEGVLATATGTIPSSSSSSPSSSSIPNKVVQVTYDSSRITYSKFAQSSLRFSQAFKTKIHIYYLTHDERTAAQIEAAKHRRDDVVIAEAEKFEASRFDLKVALRLTPMRFVPATELQKVRANRFIHQGRFDEACHVLSPRQGLILMQATRLSSKAFHDVVDIPLREAWICLCKDQDPRMPLHNRDDEEYGCDSEPDAAPEMYNLMGNLLV